MYLNYAISYHNKNIIIFSKNNVSTLSQPTCNVKNGVMSKLGSLQVLAISGEL